MMTMHSGFHPRGRHITVLLGLLFILLILPNTNAFAQVGANVGGVVRDDSGAVLPGVMIHLIERYTRTDLGTMKVEMTIDDPVAYTRPFTVTGAARLMPNEELVEYICNENNQDAPYLQGAKP